MNEKEFNLQILAKLIEVANYVFNNLVRVKDGVYTAAELYNEKDALGNKIYLFFDDEQTHTIEVGAFKCSFKSAQVFRFVWKFEQLCRVKQSDKVHFNRGANNKVIVKEKAMYYKSNGNDVITRNKSLELHSDNIATDGCTVFYKVDSMWYDLCIPSDRIEIAVKTIKENPEYIKENLLKRIESNEYINNLDIELCNALGIDREAAIQSRENCLKQREAERMERKNAILEQQKQREEAERIEKEKSIKDAEQKILNNEKIHSESFELLCEVYNIELSPKQKHCLRERIVSLNRNSYSYRSKKGQRTPKIDGIFAAYEMLKEKVEMKYKPDEFMSDKELEVLFNRDANALNICEISHENNPSNTNIPNNKENQSEPIYKRKNEVLNKDSKCYLSFEVDKHNFEIDFSGKLDTPCRINETFSSLINYLHDEKYHELARSELYERISRYAHGYFGDLGYVNHCRLGNIATELFMQRIISDINIRSE